MDLGHAQVMTNDITIDFIPNYSEDLQSSIKSWLENECDFEQRNDLDRYFNLLIQDPTLKAFDGIIEIGNNDGFTLPEPQTIQPYIQLVDDAARMSPCFQDSVDDSTSNEQVKAIAGALVVLQKSYVTNHNNLVLKMNQSIQNLALIYHKALSLMPFMDFEKIKTQMTFQVYVKFEEKIKFLKGCFFENAKEILKDIIFNYSLYSDKNRRFSKSVINVLEESFRNEPYPNEFEKERISKICKLSLRQVNNWFTNKRNRTKSTADYSLLSF